MYRCDAKFENWVLCTHVLKRWLLTRNDLFTSTQHHAFRAFELMLHPGIDLLSAFSKDEYDAFRQLVGAILY